MNKNPRAGPGAREVRRDAACSVPKAGYTDNPPPHDPEAEEAVVASMLFFQEAVGQVLSALKPEDFYTERPRRVFEAAQRLAEAGRDVNLVSVRNALPAEEQEGFLTWAAEVEHLLIGPSFVQEHIRAVKRMAEHRALRRLALEMLACEAQDPAALREEALRRLQEMGREEEEPGPPEGGWPDPPAEAAFYGLAGEIVRTLEPHTEADPAGLLLQFLVAFGNCAGRTAHYVVESDQHFMNLFAVLVGPTAKARKGTSWSRIRSIFALADPEWAANCTDTGLSSGEGLIWRVRDPIEATEPIREKGSRQVVGYQKVVTDEGVSDKRVLVVEAEFASALRVLQREGNTLSPVLREAWDTGSLTTIVKNNRARATGAHISIIAHATKQELLRYLDATEQANGFGNRFLWACVRRSRILPEGGKLHTENLQPLIRRLRMALDFARKQGEMAWDGEARAEWHRIYPELSEGRPGLLGAMVARAEAQVVRLAVIYACLDCSPAMRLPHLRAALAVWNYCERSARFVFGASLGDPVADAILQALRSAPDGLTRTALRDLFGRHKEAAQINRALTALVENGLAYRERVETDGRPAEIWYATARKATKATKDPPSVANVALVASQDMVRGPEEGEEVF